ncbi:hypothetical protein O7628_05765 [Micromonospora sp. WMMD956]|uniref:hypothetical protein n=1 Tax=Micromonospora sp. WMMD956 TaxID=3016108 RepID=UPI00241676AA|nr:hypothetical protein [Micromonospora sp. WMMD956]MDG4815014.1 hypothetical protein [Micromonospora sp. WMMD956]
MTATHPSTDPWAVTPRSTTYSTPPAGFPATADPFAPPPATAPFPVPPALAPHPAPAAGPFSAPPAAGPYSAPPVTGPYSAPPAAGPYSAPPGTGPYSAPPAAGPYSAPPAAGPYSAPPGTGAFSAPPAGPYPPALAAPLGAPQYGASSGVAVQIGEITVSPPEIRTPAGVLPLAGTQWHVADYWQTEQKVATWAIVCAVLGFFCLTIFSLLFLLIKETRHYGTVQVTVSNGPHQYVARIPVTDQGQVMHINNQVNYARSLSA